MANARWQMDRERRDRLAQLTAERHPNQIVRRIIVIDEERDAREAVIWKWDSYRVAKRKLLKVLRTVN